MRRSTSTGGLVRGRGHRPRSVIAMPVHNGSSTLDRAFRSLLEQHRRDFVLIVVDDRSSDSSAEVAETWAARDPRIVFSRNERRLGLIGNWRRCFSLARTLFPDAEYFAWAGDHDCWEAEWLGTLVGALDARSDSVLAFPRPYGVGIHRPVVSPVGVDTTYVEDPGQRLRMMSHARSAGYMVYPAGSRCGRTRPAGRPARRLERSTP